MAVSMDMKQWNKQPDPSQRPLPQPGNWGYPTAGLTPLFEEGMTHDQPVYACSQCGHAHAEMAPCPQFPLNMGKHPGVFGGQGMMPAEDEGYHMQVVDMPDTRQPWPAPSAPGVQQGLQPWGVKPEAMMANTVKNGGGIRPQWVEDHGQFQYWRGEQGARSPATQESEDEIEDIRRKYPAGADVGALEGGMLLAGIPEPVAKFKQPSPHGRTIKRSDQRNAMFAKANPAVRKRRASAPMPPVNLSLSPIHLGQYDDQHTHENISHQGDVRNKLDERRARRRSMADLDLVREDESLDMSPADLKKDYHNQAEKKRRTKLNDLVIELHGLLPKSKSIPVQKPAVIANSIDYISDLRRENGLLRRRLNDVQVDMQRLLAVNESYRRQLGLEASDMGGGAGMAPMNTMNTMNTGHMGGQMPVRPFETSEGYHV